MGQAGALLEMPAKKKGAGRPKSPEPVRSLMAVKGTGEFETWLDGLVEHTGLRTRSLVAVHALKEYAEKHGYAVPMPRR